MDHVTIPPHVEQDADAAAVEGDNGGGHDIDDATAERWMRVVIVVLVAGVLLVGAVAIGRWVLAADDEPETLGQVDIGFLQDMIDHHDQALLIANTYIDGNPAGDALPYASEVVLFQERDIARMEVWLAAAGLGRGAPDRTAMTWMGAATTVAEMHGMQTPERIAELAAARGPDADRLFFELMSAHHLGGAEMADYEAAHGSNSEILEFAAKMAYNQRIEVVEYDGAIERLGL